MNIDVCMLACSRTKALYDMTQRAINSLHGSKWEMEKFAEGRKKFEAKWVPL